MPQIPPDKPPDPSPGEAALREHYRKIFERFYGAQNVSGFKVKLKRLFNPTDEEWEDQQW